MYRCIWTLLWFPKCNLHCIWWHGPKPDPKPFRRGLLSCILVLKSLWTPEREKRNHFLRPTNKTPSQAFHVTYGWVRTKRFVFINCGVFSSKIPEVFCFIWKLLHSPCTVSSEQWWGVANVSSEWREGVHFQYRTWGFTCWSPFHPNPFLLVLKTDSWSLASNSANALFYVQWNWKDGEDGMLLLSGLGWKAEGGRSQVTWVQRPPGWLLGAFATLTTPSLPPSRTGPEAALIAVGSGGCALLTGGESHLKRYFSRIAMDEVSH